MSQKYVLYSNQFLLISIRDVLLAEKASRKTDDYRIRTYGKVVNKFWMKGNKVIKYTCLEKSRDKIEK